jgi:signal peptidase I
MNKKIIVVFIMLMGGYIIVDFLGSNYILGINDSGSLSDKIFLVNKKERKFSSGDIVAFHYSGEEYLNYKKGKLFAKIATCMPGQLLEKKGNSFYCDSKEVARALRVDSKLQRLPEFEYSGIIPQGNYFFTTPHPKSFDSRYFGFVKKDQIVGVARSIF